MSADTLWYKDAVFYELHVKTFQDSWQDGVGDFGGGFSGWPAGTRSKSEGSGGTR